MNSVVPVTTRLRVVVGLAVGAMLATLLAIASVTNPAAASAGTNTWNLARDFPVQWSAPAGPANSGTWQFVSVASANEGTVADYTPLASHNTSGCGSPDGVVEQWYGDNLTSFGNATYAVQPIVGLCGTINAQAAQVFFGPGDAAHDIGVAWTSPITGTVSISGSVDSRVGGPSGGNRTWSIWSGSTKLASDTIGPNVARDLSVGAGASALTAVHVNAGDKIYLLMNPDGTYVYGNTGVNLTITASSYAQHVLAASPSRYYRLDDGALPSVAALVDYAHLPTNGSYDSAAAQGVTGALSDGDAAAAPGSGHGLATASAVGLPTGSSARSVETWFKTSATGGSAGQRLFGYGPQSDHQMFQVNVLGGASSMVWLFWYGSDVHWTVSKNLADDAWHHLVVTYDGTSAHVVIDGIDQGAQSPPTLSTSSSGPLLIGDAPWTGNSTPFDGSIDDFAVYPTSLTADQARADYELGSPDAYANAVLADTPVAYYRLDEATGATTMIDRSGNANDGRYAGTPTFGSAGALQPSPDTAVTFGSAGYGYESAAIPRTAFTLETWVKTTDTGPTSGQWYSGEGLVDGEVGGVTDDYGLTMVNGRAAFGIGHGDTTIYSAAAINDGGWHLVDATWDTSGAMTVYVDGQQSQTGSGPTAQRTATPTLYIGRSQNGNPLQGSLDEVAVYDKVLSPARVAAHYAAAGYATNSVPSAPQHPAASPGDRSSTVTFDVPADDGGAAIDHYTVTAHPHSNGNDISHDVVDTVAAADAAPAGGSGPDSINVSGLTNGTLYDVSVVAHNAVGDGPAVTTTVTPVAPLLVTVTGSQVYGGAPTFQAESSDQNVTLDSSKLACTATTSGKTIGSSLDAGSYTIDKSTCSGATISSGNAGAYAISYVGGAFVVNRAATTLSLSPLSFWQAFVGRRTTFAVQLQDQLGHAVSGQVVQVTVPGFGVACTTAVTDVAGRASCTNASVSLLMALASDALLHRDATAAFAGSGNYTVSSASAVISMI